MEAKKYVVLSKDLQCKTVTLTELVNAIVSKKIPEGTFITLSVAVEDNNRLVYKYSAKVYANSKKLKLVSVISNEEIIYTLKNVKMQSEIKVNFSKHQFELLNETANSISETISRFQKYQTEKDIFVSETEKDLVLRRELLFILNNIDKFINYVVAGINSDDIDKDSLFPKPGKKYKCDSKNIGILVSIARISRTDYTIIDVIDDTYIIVFEK